MKTTKHQHKPRMFNETDADGFFIERVNNQERILFNLCVECECLYLAESEREIRALKPPRTRRKA